MPNAPNTVILHHGATTAQIGTGDVLIERVTTGGVESQLPAAVQYVFATVPALASYSDGQGNSATISYPVTTPVVANGAPVAAGPNGDVVVTLTFWRPQRRPIPPETGEWIDIGHLGYAVQVASGDFGACPPSAFSSTDPNLTPASSPTGLGPDAGGFTDLAADQPASPANTFTYTLNLTQCLASHGVSFNSGETRTFSFSGGTNSGDRASQGVSFKRQ